MRFVVFTLFIASITCPAFTAGDESGNPGNDPIFPTPSILKDNVAFWTKVYTEIPMGQGVLHDRDYPLVIFKKIAGESGSGNVKAERKRIVEALANIVSTPDSALTVFERQILELYKKYADSSAIPGAADRVRFQQGQTERFKEGLRRSGMYLDTIRAILRRYGVPERLAYLPHVESSFNTEAYSKVGAAGLWQFMRGTGKLYGMRIDYTIDERRDPVTATVAAAKYLSSSFEQLGTWPLAITSYNHGVYGMKRAVNKTGSRDIEVIIRKYDSRSFQFASSNFYSCFLAASAIAADHSRYFPDVKLLEPLAYHDFAIGHYIGADEFCMHTGIPRDMLIRLNPAIRPAVFAKHQKLPKGFAIHIPASRPLAEIAMAYGAIPDSLKMSAPPRPQYYRVNYGDNLYAIASRLGVSVQELAYENGITRLNRIRSGQVLRIPAKSSAGAPEATVQTASVVPSRTSTAPVTTPEVVRAAIPPIPTTPAGAVTADAAAEIAQAEAEASVPPEEIAMSEKETGRPPEVSMSAAASKKSGEPRVTPSVSPLPQTPLSDSLKEIAFTPALVEPVKKNTEKPKIAPTFDVSIYDLDAVLSPVGTNAKITVSVDETIGHYADWLGIPTWRIRKLNDMGRRSNILINQKLLIPVDRADALEQFAAARLEYHMAIEEDFHSQYAVSDVVPHILRSGEALWDICNNSENPLPLWLFRKYNRHLDLNRLTAGSEVWIPQVNELTEEEIRNLQSAPVSPRPVSRPYLQRPGELKRIP